MSNEIARMLGDLAKMKAADRAAILAKLTEAERARLTEHAADATAKLASARAPKERKLALPACSPWLAKRLSRLIESTDASATEAARDAARIVIANLAGTPTR
jgi:hypothetical protein